MSDNCCIVTRLDTQEVRYQVSLFLVTIGQDALEIYNIFEYATSEDKNKLRTLTDKFDAYFVGELNETYERYVFNQRCHNASESFECYYSSLKYLAKTCNFGTLQDSLIKDRVILCIRHNDTRKR